MDFGRLKVKSKVWVELEGEPVLGDAKVRLLEEIDAKGSIKAAASALGMTYRGAWAKLRAMEERLGERLVERRAGGPSGGGSTLTPLARELVRRYKAFREGINEYVDTKFEKTFRT